MADASAGYQIASWSWRNREEIGNNLIRVWNWIRGKDSPQPLHGILILGPNGSGKTTLAELLSERIDWLADTPGYRRA